MNQTPAVILNVQRQPGANTTNVVKAIKNLMPQLQGNCLQVFKWPRSPILHGALIEGVRFRC